MKIEKKKIIAEIKIKKIVAFILIGLAIVIMVMCISNPLLASVVFSPEREYQVTYRRIGSVCGIDSHTTVKKKAVLKLFMGKEIIQDDSQKDIGKSYGDAVYLVIHTSNGLIAYYNNAPDHAVVFYLGKCYRITNPEYPIPISSD